MAKRKMLATEYAREDGIDPHLFLWWDKNEGRIYQTRYQEIKSLVYKIKVR